METQKIIAGIVAGGTLVMGGVDASVLNETAIQRVETVAQERVEAKQIGNVVETTLTWKGENGLKVKYDMGEPTAAEMLKDKRDKEVVTDLVDFGDGGFKVDILLNKKPDTNVFCYTIDGAENYDFWYQPALTQQEIDEGTERPDNIIGSYAVYHKTLRNHEVDKTNYETGKVMHIPRPQVWEVNDKENTTIWADLSYNEGQLCVTVDSIYLQKAKYPVRVDPTFGYTSIGASGANSTLQAAYFVNATPSSSGTVSKITYYSRYNATATSLKAVLWLVSDKTIITDGVGGTVSVNNGTPQWWDMTYSVQPSISSGTAYHIGVVVGNVGDGAYRYYDTGGAGSGGYSNGNNYATPTSIGTILSSERLMSSYATYTAGGGGGGEETKQDSDFWFE